MVKLKALYKVGDLVEVHQLPPSMSHFYKGIGNITQVSHNSCQAGNDWEWSYGVDFVEWGESCWYYHSNMKLVDIPKLSDRELLLLSSLYPRIGDAVVLGTKGRSMPYGTKGIIVELDSSGEYGVSWEKYGTIWWFSLSDFKGYEDSDHPLEYYDVEE